MSIIQIIKKVFVYQSLLVLMPVALHYQVSPPTKHADSLQENVCF